MSTPYPVKAPRKLPRTIAIVAVVITALLLYDYFHPRIKERKVVTTPSGLQYADLVVGTGPLPIRGQEVTVHYVGTLENGAQFDSSRERESPLPFAIGTGQVIKGWDEGVMTMRVGGRRKLIIPPGLAYGDRGMPNAGIPPGATLLFDVELMGVK